MKKARTKQSKWMTVFYVFFALAWVVVIVGARSKGSPLNVRVGAFFACAGAAVAAAATSCVSDGVVGRGTSRCTREGEPFGFWFQVGTMYLFAAGVFTLAVMAFTKHHG